MRASDDGVLEAIMKIDATDAISYVIELNFIPHYIRCECHWTGSSNRTRRKFFKANWRLGKAQRLIAYIRWRKISISTFSLLTLNKFQKFAEAIENCEKYFRFCDWIYVTLNICLNYIFLLNFHFSESEKWFFFSHFHFDGTRYRGGWAIKVGMGKSETVETSIAVVRKKCGCIIFWHTEWNCSLKSNDFL